MRHDGSSCVKEGEGLGVAPLLHAQPPANKKTTITFPALLKLPLLRQRTDRRPFNEARLHAQPPANQETTFTFSVPSNFFCLDKGKVQDPWKALLGGPIARAAPWKQGNDFYVLCPFDAPLLRQRTGKRTFKGSLRRPDSTRSPL